MWPATVLLKSCCCSPELFGWFARANLQPKKCFAQIVVLRGLAVLGLQAAVNKRSVGKNYLESLIDSEEVGFVFGCYFVFGCFVVDYFAADCFVGWNFGGGCFGFGYFVTDYFVIGYFAIGYFGVASKFEADSIIVRLSLDSD